MALGLIGQKCGMTRIFTENGDAIPVTVISVTPNRVTQIKTLENDGYQAVQVTAGHKPKSRLTKPLIGHFLKAGVEAGNVLHEFRVQDNEVNSLSLGSEITASLFTEGQKVDVQSVSRGKGFAGTIKRHNFSMQDATHGNSLSHRAPGSSGQNQTPGRVFKGKKMAGQMGNVICTVQNQRVMKIDLEKNLILIKGVVPGAPGARVIITKSIKAREKQ